MPDDAPEAPPTVLALSESDQRFVLFAGLGAGAALGLVGHCIWPLVAGWGFIPLHGLWDAIFGNGALPAVLLRVAGGAVAGLCAGAAINIFNPVVTITDGAITIRTPNGGRDIRKDQVAGIFREGGKVVIQTAEGRDLYRGDMEGTEERIAAAFRRHGYPWEGPAP